MSIVSWLSLSDFGDNWPLFVNFALESVATLIAASDITG